MLNTECYVYLNAENVNVAFYISLEEVSTIVVKTNGEGEALYM